jgi:two-component system cell cycle response regulator
MSLVLVVDDNPTNLDLMLYLLKAFGHAPLAAHDGQEGIDIAKRERPDLILMDIHMPGLDGYEAARMLRSDPALRDTPLVAVTALAMVGDREKILEAGFDGYIAKPIDPEAFVGLVDGFLQPGSRRQPGPLPSIGSPAAGSAPRAAAARRATILVVDDSPVNLNLMRSTFEPSGYEVLTFLHPMEALASARKKRPDLILSDVHMSPTSGHDFLGIVKADPDLRSIPFIFISSTVWQDRDREMGLALGADRFIARPIDPEKLLAEIEQCLKHLE